jgi:hypothetical protein
MSYGQAKGNIHMPHISHHDRPVCDPEGLSMQIRATEMCSVENQP